MTKLNLPWLLILFVGSSCAACDSTVGESYAGMCFIDGTFYAGNIEGTVLSS